MSPVLGKLIYLLGQRRPYGNLMSREKKHPGQGYAPGTGTCYRDPAHVISLLGGEELPLLKVEDKTQDYPDDQEIVALLTEVYAGDTRDRDKLKDHEGNGESDSDTCHELKEGTSVTVSFRCDKGTCTGEEVTDGCADGTHVNEPTQGLSSQDGAGKADDNAEDHGVLGGAVLLVNDAEPLGNVSVTAHGVHETGGGQVEAHDTGEDGATYADTDKDLTEGSEKFLGGDQEHPLTCHYTVGPVLKSSGRHRIVTRINEASEHDRNDHDDAYLLEAEVEFLRSLGDGVEAHICPGSDGKGCEDGTENSARSHMGELTDILRGGICRHGRSLIESPDGFHVDTRGLCAEDARQTEGDGADDQEAREHRLNDGCLLNADDIEPAEEDQDRHRQDHLTHPHVKSRDLIVESEFQYIRGTVQTVNDKADRRAVHGNVGKICHHQEPSAKEGGILAEAHLGERELTSRLGVLGYHVGVGECYNYHYQGTEDHGDRRTRHTGVGKEFLTGIYEASPSDNTSEGNGPDVHGI